MKTTSYIHKANVIIIFVLGILCLSAIPFAKAASDDYVSYNDELRHKEQYLDEMADDKAMDMANSQEESMDANVPDESIGNNTGDSYESNMEAKPKVDAPKAVYKSDVAASETMMPEPEQKPVSDTSMAEKTYTSSADKYSHMNSDNTSYDYSNTASYDDWMVKPEDYKRHAPTDELSRQLGIDKALRQAKSIVVPKPAPVVVEKPVVKEFDTQTDMEIIDGLIKPELQKTKIDLEFREATLSDVFMTLGKSGEINVMLDPIIKNLTIDIFLKQVSLKEAFILIANSHNLGFKRIEGSLFITTKDKLKEQTVAYKVIKLRNVKALEVKAMVADLIKIVNVSEQINSLIVVGQPDEIAKVEKVIKTIDKAQPQVILEAKIVEVNKDALKDLGVDWSDQVSLSYQESGRPVEIPNTATPENPLLNIGAFERSPIAFSTLIKMLENQNKAKVLSNPRVTTMNEKEAEIFVGDRIPYTVTTVSGGVATTDVRFEEPGIRLRITPTIIDGDFVVIKVEPEVSFIFSFRGPDNQYPWVKKRHATAYVRVRNNQPFVLGGLLNQEDKKNLYKVPMLGNVPWLGNLFSYEKHTVSDTELIITITPTVVQGNY